MGFMKKLLPDIPEPKAPPPPPTFADFNVDAAGKRQRAGAAAQRNSTVLTSPGGDTSTPNTSTKSLIGE